jgi:hypothetical protein
MEEKILFRLKPQSFQKNIIRMVITGVAISLWVVFIVVVILLKETFVIVSGLFALLTLSFFLYKKIFPGDLLFTRERLFVPGDFSIKWSDIDNFCFGPIDGNSKKTLLLISTNRTLSVLEDSATARYMYDLGLFFEPEQIEKAKDIIVSHNLANEKRR